MSSSWPTTLVPFGMLGMGVEQGLGVAGPPVAALKGLDLGLSGLRLAAVVEEGGGLRIGDADMAFVFEPPTLGARLIG